MNRELFLLSPYRFPTQHTLMLNADDVAIILNGYLSLWHPAALREATALPKIVSPYDHETPVAGNVYAVPESPPVFLPDDWEQRCASVGAVFFKASSDREATQRALLDALSSGEPCTAPPGPFHGLGLGYVVLETLFEAMDHLPQLSTDDFLSDLRQAIVAPDQESCRQHLQSAAQRLVESREVVYPSHIYLVDLIVLEARGAAAELPLSLEFGMPSNLLASADFLRRLKEEQPDHWQKIQDRLKAELLAVATGSWRDREDALLPVESQLWNLRKGWQLAHELLGQEPQIHGRRRFAASPQTPQFLHALGQSKAVLLPLDEAVLPQYRSAVIEWTSPSGHRVEALTRKPVPAESPDTYFHLAHHLSKTIMQDMTASLLFLHTNGPECSYYRDWLELNRLAPVFGQLTTLHQFLTEVSAGEYPAPPGADEFHSDYLHELCSNNIENPASCFRTHTRERRKIDVAGTLAAMLRGVSREPVPESLLSSLDAAEDDLECGRSQANSSSDAILATMAQTLAQRLVSRAAESTPGFLLINACSFPRCVGVELAGVRTPLPSPARATQLEGEQAKAVVDVPALGFAWIPSAVPAGTKVHIPRGKLADERFVRNDLFEAEIDTQTGGLRALRDVGKRVNRLGQQLIFGPGSTMRMSNLRVTSTGPALGEIITEGILADAYDQPLATYRQRFRAWWSRPILEIQIQLDPRDPPTGYPWHAFYGTRFAWRDERARIVRSVNLQSFPTTQSRPETPEYVEIASGAERTSILLGGLPFTQRQGSRMLDLILMPPGETARVFELGLGMDLADPVQASLAFITPVQAIPVEKGPPHVGVSGWLYHVDAANLVLASLRPTEDGADAVVARLMESRGAVTSAEFRCPRNPARACGIDERGGVVEELEVQGDAVKLSFMPHEMKRVRVDFA